MKHSFYHKRRVLITGHTGFKGAWLSLWLRELGATVCGLALPQDGSSAIYGLLPVGTFEQEHLIDIRDPAAVCQAVVECRPDVVFHLAAQPLVRLSYQQPLETVAVNVMGTLHLLDALRTECPQAQALVVTSDKCYENQHWLHGYRETDPMGGHDPYSMSKGACELAVSSWRRSFILPDPAAGRLMTARAGNVIGGGDFSADRIVPDCMRALAAGRSIQVRNPNSTRPWQHVLDCLSGYLLLMEKAATTPGWQEWSFNFGPTAASNQPVRALVGEILKHWPGTLQDLSEPGAPHEASLLHLSTDKAAFLLGWQPTWNFADAVRETTAWYRAAHEGRDMSAFTLAQLRAYLTQRYS
jgi:CDP-glucose 4,6-dehydratase